MRRYLFALIFGLGGVAILIALGNWQIRRLVWKEALIAGIEARIHDAPVALPTAPDPARDQYLPVTVTGVIGTPALRMLSGQDGAGAGYRIIAPLATGGRVVLLDRGFIPEAAVLQDPPEGSVTVTGNLLWPDESDGFTPPPDLDANLWFARDVVAMARILGTAPVLIVARDGAGGGALVPAPVETVGIPNNHKQYAITWFSLAGVWAGMTVFLLWRIRQRSN